MQIDLNCDLGESSDPKQLEVEARILTSISSVNIACGGSLCWLLSASFC